MNENTNVNANTARSGTQTKVTEPSESAVRQKAHRRLYRLTKFSERSRWYNQYGPYALVNDRNCMEDYGLSLAEANEILDSMQPARRGVDYFDGGRSRRKLAAHGRRALKAGAT